MGSRFVLLFAKQGLDFFGFQPRGLAKLFLTYFTVSVHVRPVKDWVSILLDVRLSLKE